MRYDLDDPMISKFQNMLLDIFNEFTSTGVAYFDSYPIVESLVPKFAYKAFGVSAYLEKSGKMMDYLQVSINDFSFFVETISICLTSNF